MVSKNYYYSDSVLKMVDKDIQSLDSMDLYAWFRYRSLMRLKCIDLVGFLMPLPLHFLYVYCSL